MPGSFLFTQNTAGQHGGAGHVRPLLRSANNNVASFNQAVANAVAQGLVNVNGTTIYMAADVAFMMIGRKSELRTEVGAANMAYTQIRSAAANTDLNLYRMKFKPSPAQTDHIYVLAGPAYWNGAFGPDLSRVNIQDNNGRSWSLELGLNPQPNRRDNRNISDQINRVKN